MPHITTADGCNIFYDTQGFEDDAQAKPVVVFLNGMTQSTLHWSSHARALRDQYRVLTYDARGQGQSDIGDLDLTIEQHAADLTAILDHLNIDQANLVGFSHGARVALGFANHSAHRLDRLILCSATAEPTALARTIIRAWYEVLRLGGLEAMAWSSLPTILGSQYLAQNERLLSSIIKASITRNSQQGVLALLEAMMKYPGLADLARNVRHPTLVISASEDLLVTASGAQELAELCHGEHIEFEGLGHTIPIEDPAKFRTTVLDFLQR